MASSNPTSHTTQLFQVPTLTIGPSVTDPTFQKKTQWHHRLTGRQCLESLQECLENLQEDRFR